MSYYQRDLRFQWGHKFSKNEVKNPRINETKIKILTLLLDHYTKVVTNKNEKIDSSCLAEIKMCVKEWFVIPHIYWIQNQSS